MKSITVPLAAALLLTTSLGAQAGTKTFEGTVAVTETRGGTASSTLYTRRGDLVRVETPGATTPVPVNVFDLAAKKLTIVYPHNRSFTVVDLAQPDPPGPNLSAGMPTPPPTAVKPGPINTPPAGFPTPPGVPNNPMAGGGMPMMPPMPPMPPMGAMGRTPELKKTDKTKQIHGFDCTLYTLGDRMETMNIWATPDKALFPFQLLQSNYHRRHFGPVMLEEEWAALLQKQNLFPLEAILLMQTQQQARYTFKVDKIDNRKIEDDSLFKAPAEYFEIQAPPF